MADWVLGPLGLTDSASLQLPPGGQPADSPVACGHAFDAGLVFPVRPSGVLALGAGELVATARDAAALGAAPVKGQLLSAESASEMLVPYARCGPDTWQGLGHGGTFPGFDAAACACPETGGSAALLANTNTGLLMDHLRTALLPDTGNLKITPQP